LFHIMRCYILQIATDCSKLLGRKTILKCQPCSHRPAILERKLPRASEDIAEAGKCFALTRYTACVFHLMRVMELAVQELGKRLNIKLTGEKNWQNILDEVNKALKALPAKTPAEKKKQARLAEASANLFNVKLAWRNPAMHPKRTYTEEEAERLMTGVKAFVRHIYGVKEK
jgi:HEPN domain-containing protein